MESPDNLNSNAIGVPHGHVVVSRQDLEALHKRISDVEKWHQNFEIVGSGFKGRGNQWYYDPSTGTEQPEQPE